MAEVPEVETIVRDLREAVVGRTIHAAEVLLPSAVRFPTVDECTTLLTDRVVLESQRRAFVRAGPKASKPRRDNVIVE